MLHVEMQEVLGEHQQPELNPYQPSEKLLGTRRQDKSWQMAQPLCLAAGLGHAPSTPGLCSPWAPQPQPLLCPRENVSIPKAPSSRCHGRAGFHGQFTSILLLLSHPRSPLLSQTLSLAHLHVPNMGHHHIYYLSPLQYNPGDTYCRPEAVPFLPPVSAPGRGDVPAPVTCLSPACPWHPQPSTQQTGGIIAQWKDMPSIDLQSNLIGLQRPLDCFHSEQGLKKYINKSIDPMATQVRAGCGSPLPAKGVDAPPASQGSQSSFLWVPLP